MPRGNELSAWEVIRLRWELLLRNGVQTSSGRVSSAGILFRWMFSLVVLHVAMWISGFPTRPFLGLGNITYFAGEDLASQEFWRGRHLIFSASAGRAGSAYLRSVLECADSVYSLHEPIPKMNGPDLVHVLLEGRRVDTLRDRRARKLGAIRDALLGTHESVVYAETSHMFIKTFADAVLSEVGDVAGANVTILVPTRNLFDVVLSQLQLGWFASNHSGRGVWYYAPSDLHITERNLNLSHPSDHSAIADAVGYNLDIVERTLTLKKLVDKQHSEGRWTGVRVVEVSINDIAPQESLKISQFLLSLGLSPISEKISMLQEQDENRREFKKERASADVSLEQIRLELERNPLSRLSR